MNSKLAYQNIRESVKIPSRRTLLFSAINLTIVGTLLYYLYTHADQYLGLLHLSPFRVISLLLLASLFPFINGLINIYMFRSLGAALALQDGVYIAAASTLANELPISGGLIAKGVYLKRLHNVSYTKYFSATLALFFCTVAVNGIIGLITLLYWVFVRKMVVSAILLLGFSGMASCFLIFWLPLNRIRIRGKVQVWISQSVEGWILISSNPLLLFRLLGLQSILMLLLAARYWLAFKMLSQFATIGQVILFSSATVLTQLVSIAPGGLGVREAIVGAISSLLGFNMGISVAAVGLDRLVSTVFNVVVGWYSITILGKQIAQGQQQSTGE